MRRYPDMPKSNLVKLNIGVFVFFFGLYNIFKGQTMPGFDGYFTSGIGFVFVLMFTFWYYSTLNAYLNKRDVFLKLAK